MNQIVAITAETALINGLGGRFVAWNQQHGRFQERAVSRDFTPSYQATGGTFTKSATRSPPQWAETEIERLIELRSTGMLWRQIGKELGKCAKLCCAMYINTCQRRGIQPVLNTASRRTLSDNDKARAIALKTQKMSARNIARALELPMATVSAFLSAYTAKIRLERFRDAIGDPQMPNRTATKAMQAVHTNPALTPITLDPTAHNALAVIRYIVCEYFCMRLDVFIRGGRSRAVVRARHIYFYLARKHTMRSFPQIALNCGAIDHTTVMHGVKRVQEKIADHADDLAAVEKVLGVRN